MICHTLFIDHRAHHQQQAVHHHRLAVNQTKTRRGNTRRNQRSLSQKSLVAKEKKAENNIQDDILLYILISWDQSK